MLYKSLILPFNKLFSKIPKIVFDILFWSIIGFVFLGCINFLGKQGIFIIISLFLMMTYVVLKSKIVISLPIILSFLFALSYSVPVFIYTRSYFSTALLYSFCLPIIAEYFEVFEDKKKLTVWLLSAFIGGLFVSFLLMIISTYWRQGGDLSGDVINTFWDNNLMSRTGLSLYEIAAIAVLFVCLCFKNYFRKWYTLPLISLALIFCFIVSLRVGNRSFLVPFALVVYVVLVFKYFQPKGKAIWTVLLILFHVLFVGFFIIYMLYNYQVIKLPESLLKIKIFDRLFNLSVAEGRPNLIGEFFTKFYKYPFGNLNNNLERPFVHNIILDFYAFGGIAPFVIGTTFFVFLFIKLFHFSSSKYHSQFTKALLFCLVMSVFALAMVEPIYQGNANCPNTLFIIFLYLLYAEKEDKKLKEQNAPTYDELEAANAEKEVSKDDGLYSIPVFTQKIVNPSESAIILIAYDKPEALEHSFKNLLTVDYLGKKVDLVISIDNSGNNKVVEMAKTLKWPFGNKFIRTFKERQGLKKHILQCFQYAEVYNVLFLLEDDIYVSKAMFAYGYNAAKFFDNSQSIAGISLYNFQGNWQDWSLRFEPYNSGFDNYFMKLAQSWGEVITTKQWLRFKTWYEQNKKFIKDERNVESINHWPESSWLKYFDRYCFTQDKYFVYPYVSVATNCNGAGIHNVETINDFQVELQTEVKNYKFQPFNKLNSSTIIYDEYMNPTWLYNYLGYKRNELTIDLWCTKRRKQFLQ